MPPRDVRPDHSGGPPYYLISRGHADDEPCPRMWSANARAPLPLLEHTIEVRLALHESGWGVDGSCLPAAYVLGWRLELDGWSPTFVSDQQWPHLFVRVGDWGLDPTSEQFGGEGFLVFQIGSEYDRYEPTGQWTLCEEEIISELAQYLACQLPHPDGNDWRRDAIEPLLAAVGLAPQLPAVEEAAEAYAAEIHQRIREEMEWSEARDEA